MRYFYDTEFIEDGETIELVSLGVVAEDGREFYAVSSDFDPASANAWVRGHVLDQLPPPADPAWQPRSEIRARLVEFLRAGPGRPMPDLWAWVGDYDHVVLAQLWGDMGSLPRYIPHFTHELKQYWELIGRPELPARPRGSHDALVDARYNLERFRACERHWPLDENNRLRPGR
ncbi:polyadenylate-specific 3'-exoribonuclease AS [Corynebacterium otitidis]|uniref:polyadenylate-specific 3'-exoribonuclease AS n=1 Tax=Corynebacterium otitidis TaxID=29321 RepID=UPI000627C5FF|nr:polyadenylate-specific 3'-exoribonuclease AS [Corynebacterium otitidis]KKO84527.1 hypothetical protein AAV33_01015 [Corynebacterium otitidis]